MKILATVAARGKSKGLKNKNIKNLLGRPLISYTIEQLNRWGKFDKLVVSTDSKQIAAVARRYGAEVPFIRPAGLGGDSVAKIDVLRHALLEAEKHYNMRFDLLVDLDATAPIRKISDLDKCLRIFKRRKPKTLFSVVKSRKNPYFNMVEKKKGKIVLSKSWGTKKAVATRQSAPAVYDLNASIYFYQRDYLADRKNSSVISDNSLVYVMDEISAFDIDTELDFKFIEFLIKEGVWKNEV